MNGQFNNQPEFDWYAADEQREQEWEQAVSDEPPTTERHYEYPTCQYCGTRHSDWIPCPDMGDTGGKETVIAMENLPLCEVFDSREIKRLEFLKHRIATGQIDPRD